jgi:hypothetical protein
VTVLIGAASRQTSTRSREYYRKIDTGIFERFADEVRRLRSPQCAP